MRSAAAGLLLMTCHRSFHAHLAHHLNRCKGATEGAHTSVVSSVQFAVLYLGTVLDKIDINEQSCSCCCSRSIASASAAPPTPTCATTPNPPPPPPPPAARRPCDPAAARPSAAAPAPPARLLLPPLAPAAAAAAAAAAPDGSVTPPPWYLVWRLARSSVRTSLFWSFPYVCPELVLI